MLIVMKSGSSREDVNRVRDVIQGLGLESQPLPVAERLAVRVSGYAREPSRDLFETLPGVDLVLPVTQAVHRVGRHAQPGDTVLRFGSHVVGNGGFSLVAGPCAVESEEQILAVAREVQAAGAHFLRGGAYKPRTSPYEFQGLGEEGLKLLALARRETGLPVITEAVDEASVDLAEEYADVIQIGARNMQNFALLKRAGRSRLPVLLKRGMSASLEDLMLSAEYLLDAGNSDVILCERGIRSFSNHSRFTLDLSIVPVLKQMTHLPIFVDPSHASGNRQSVAPLARASMVVGADGVMIEVHPDPIHALCDGPQSLRPAEFATLAASLRALIPFIAEQRETVS
jgi:3-deoxy-7-phosphoheptulonate synthase